MILLSLVRTESIIQTIKHVDFSVVQSAFDPVFWLHHSQVDRLLCMWAAFHPDVWVSDPDLHKGHLLFCGDEISSSFTLSLLQIFYHFGIPTHLSGNLAIAVIQTSTSTTHTQIVQVELP